MRVPVVIAIILLASTTYATGLRIDETQVSSEKPWIVSFTVSWQNGWRNDRNHDAAWLFVKTRQQNGSWQHVRVAAMGHELVGTGRIVVPPQSRRGVCHPLCSSPRQRKVGGAPNAGPGRRGPGETRVYGLEVVHVPQGHSR